MLTRGRFCIRLDNLGSWQRGSGTDLFCFRQDRQMRRHELQEMRGKLTLATGDLSTGDQQWSPNWISPAAVTGNPL
jgi:hypothetical protein